MRSQEPRVSPYRLTTHLTMAFSLYVLRLSRFLFSRCLAPCAPRACVRACVRAALLPCSRTAPHHHKSRSLLLRCGRCGWLMLPVVLISQSMHQVRRTAVDCHGHLPRHPAKPDEVGIACTSREERAWRAEGAESAGQTVAHGGRLHRPDCHRGRAGGRKRCWVRECENTLTCRCNAVQCLMPP